MSLLFALGAAATLASGVDARSSKFMEVSCTPLKEHLGVFADSVVMNFKENGVNGDIVKLLNVEKQVKDSDKVTFFMPSGSKAKNTLMALKDSEFGHPEATFNGVELGEVIRNHFVLANLANLPNRPMGTLTKASKLKLDTKDGKRYLGCSHVANEAELTSAKKIDTCVGPVYTIDDVLVPNTVACSAPFQQCGGLDWDDPNCCAQTAGKAYSCMPQDQYYSQCKPVEDMNVASSESLKSTDGETKSVEMVKEVETDGCAPAYQQCGGQTFDGPTCCTNQNGKEFFCEYQNKFFSQCQYHVTMSTTAKVTQPVASGQEQAEDKSVMMASEIADDGCAPAYTQCGGEGFEGPTCCGMEDGMEFVCDYQNNFFSQCLLKTEVAKRPGQIKVVVGGANAEVEMEAGDEAAAAENPDMVDVYMFFPQKDFVPMGDGIDKIDVEDIAGASKKVTSQEQCAKFCSDTDGCNAASYYIDGNAYGGKNCWLKTADFEDSEEVTSCTLPAAAVDDPNAVLLFLIDDTCEDDTIGAEMDVAAMAAPAPAPAPVAVAAPAPAAAMTATTEPADDAAQATDRAVDATTSEQTATDTSTPASSASGTLRSSVLFALAAVAATVFF